MLKRLWLSIAIAVVVTMSCSAARMFAQTKGEAGAEKAATAQERRLLRKKTTSIADKTKSMEKMPGYFNIYWDAKAGKLWLEIDKWETEFLYQSSLPAGIGSNDIGLDRGQLGGTHVVRFERSGPKVLLVQANLEFRAVSNDADERRAVRDSFAESALWGFSVAAEDGERALVDATDFFLRDAHGVSRRAAEDEAGDLSLGRFAVRAVFAADEEFSVEHGGGGDAHVYGRRAGAVGEASDSGAGRDYGARASLVCAIAAGGVQAARLRSAVELSRDFVYGLCDADQRADCKEICGAPSAGEKRSIGGGERGGQANRLLPGLAWRAPEPISVRTARRRARWWAQAFEAAGFKNAFRVELMPEDADPMDVRYNVIQWIHRATRGWSYGATVTDPRTGEIIKGSCVAGVAACSDRII